MKKINGLYRAKVGRGHFDPLYRDDDTVKFIRYIKPSKHVDHVVYDLVTFSNKVVGRSNKFTVKDINWKTRYLIKQG